MAQSDLDVLRTAKLYLDWHGADAPAQAARAASRRVAAGDLAGAVMWRRVLLVIGTLQTEGEASQTLH